MIKNDEQLQRTQLGINKLEAGLAALKREVLPLNAQRFAIMAEPVVDQIRELRRLVDEYIGFTSAVELRQLMEQSMDFQLNAMSAP